VSREWTLVFDMPCEWLTANIDRDKYKRASLVKRIRAAVVKACEIEGLPKAVGPVTIHGIIHYTSKASPVRDRLNLAPTIKALVDGMTPAKTYTRDGKTHHVPGYGFLADDSDKHVLDTTWELKRAHRWTEARWGVIQLTITERKTQQHQQLSLLGDTQ
jgi:hypothetical protein